MSEKIEELKQIIKEAKAIVFMTGAGVSVASGIPDFRSANGLYSTKYGKYQPEEILSHSFFIRCPDEFYRFYREKMIYKDATYNVIHKTMALLEKVGKVKAIVTQNIDGLHQDAGSKEVLELHGTIRKNECLKCHKEYDLDYIIASKGVPTCRCGGIIKPLVTLYEESLDYDTLEKSVEYIANADTLIVVGTSLLVNPAASLVNYYRGKNFIIINLGDTPYDHYARLVIHDDAKKVFSEIEKDYL